MHFGYWYFPKIGPILYFALGPKILKYSDTGLLFSQQSLDRL